MKGVKHIFAVVLLCFIITSCDRGIFEPEFEDCYLFIEYGVCNDVRTIAGDGFQYEAFEPGQEGYFFNETTRELQIDRARCGTVSSSDNFIFGNYCMLKPNTSQSGLLKSQKYFYCVDSIKSALINLHFKYEGEHPNNYGYEITMISSNKSGNVRIYPLNLSRDTIWLSPNEIFTEKKSFSASAENPTSIFIISDSITIINHGFIKKSDVGYY